MDMLKSPDDLERQLSQLDIDVVFSLNRNVVFVEPGRRLTLSLTPRMCRTLCL